MSMPMPSTTRFWTVDEVRALPDDGNRYELIDGALCVTPAPMPRHQRAVARLTYRLEAYAQSVGRLFVFPAPNEVVYGPRVLVEPDIMVVSSGGGPLPARWEDVGPLLLAVEVLSPSTARVDRTSKRRLYQREGVPEYWVVDLDSRLVERWRPDDERPEILDARLVLQPHGATEPLVIDLPELFREILDA